MFFYCAGVLVSSLRDLISSFNYGYQCRVPNGTWFLYLSRRDRTLVESRRCFETNPVRDDTKCAQTFKQRKAAAVWIHGDYIDASMHICRIAQDSSRFFASEIIGTDTIDQSRCICSLFCASVFVSSQRDLISTVNYGYLYCVPTGTWFFIRAIATVYRNIAPLAGLGCVFFVPFRVFIHPVLGSESWQAIEQFATFKANEEQ